MKEITKTDSGFIADYVKTKLEEEPIFGLYAPIDYKNEIKNDLEKKGLVAEIVPIKELEAIPMIKIDYNANIDFEVKNYTRDMFSFNYSAILVRRKKDA